MISEKTFAILAILIITVAYFISYTNTQEIKLNISAAQSGLQQCLVQEFPKTVLWQKECK